MHLLKEILENVQKDAKSTAEESKIKPEVEIPVSDNCRSPIFKRKRYSGDTDDKELVYDKLKTPVKISSEENEDLLACLEDSSFSTTPVKTQKSPEKSIKEEVNAKLLRS